jgi:hypothetical protein
MQLSPVLVTALEGHIYAGGDAWEHETRPSDMAIQGTDITNCFREQHHSCDRGDRLWENHSDRSGDPFLCLGQVALLPFMETALTALMRSADAG